MKVVKIEREVTEEVVETLEHALELAKLGEIIGIVGAFQLKDGITRKVVHGSYLEDLPKAIGELETVKMWLFSEMGLYEVPPKDEELKEIQEQIKKEKQQSLIRNPHIRK